MFIYSKKIIKFVDEIKREIKFILSNEIHRKVHGDRFYNVKQNVSYPIIVVIYNNRNMLGYFDSNFYELGFHECLMHVNKTQLHNIIRHELAHYMTFLNYGRSVQSHGTEFREFCRSVGWGEEVYKATIELEEGVNSSVLEENGILRKVQKLMALTTSSNQNESEQAMIKAQQLLMTHNIDAKYVDSEKEERIFLKRIMKQKKETAKMRSIARILQTFFVNTVFNRSKDSICLEILGNAVNLEIAEYVAEILHLELERLWDQAKQQSNLSGMSAKNSFFYGIATGYCNKVDFLKKEYTSEVTKALMVIEKQLIDAKEMVYKRLSSTKSRSNYCAESSALGEKMGKQLNINPGLNKAATNTGSLLNYSKLPLSQ